MTSWRWVSRCRNRSTSWWRSSIVAAAFYTLCRPRANGTCWGLEDAVMKRMWMVGAMVVVAMAGPARADEQRIAPGTGTQDAVVIDTGLNGLCETAATRGD